MSLLSDSRNKLAHDIKSTMAALEDAGLPAAGFYHDLMLYAFLLCADPSGCSAETLAEKYLNRKLLPYPDHAAEAALAVFEKLAPEVDKQGLRDLYDRIDLPLTYALVMDHWADLVLFDPVTVRDVADFNDPQRAAQGIDGVWVNGVLSYQEGQSSGRHAGRFLAREDDLRKGFV